MNDRVTIAWPDGRKETVPENYALRLIARGEATIAAQEKAEAKGKRKKSGK